MSLSFLKFILNKNEDDDWFNDIDGEAEKFLGNTIIKKDKDEGLHAFMELDRILSGDLTEEESENEDLVNAIRNFKGLGQETNKYEDEFNELIGEGILQKDYFEKMDEDEKKGKVCSISGEPADYKVKDNYSNGLEKYKEEVDLSEPSYNTENIPHNLIDKALEIEYISQEVYDKLSSGPCDGCVALCADREDMCNTCLPGFMGLSPNNIMDRIKAIYEKDSNNIK